MYAIENPSDIFDLFHYVVTGNSAEKIIRACRPNVRTPVKQVRLIHIIIVKNVFIDGRPGAAVVSIANRQQQGCGFEPANRM